MAYTVEYIEHGRAYFAALGADRRWQLELDYQEIDRYAPEAKGTEGSELRLRYNAKLRADEDLRAATDALRAAGTPLEVEAIERVAAFAHEFQSMHGTDACWHCDSDHGQH